MAKTQIVSASGGLTSQSAGSASSVFDDNLTTQWYSGGLTKSNTFGTKSGLVFRTWSIDAVQSVQVYSDGCATSCSAQISLALLEEDSWKPVSLSNNGVLSREKGWHAVFLSTAITVPQRTTWRIIIEKQHIKGSVQPVPSASGVYPLVNEIRVVGTGPRHALAAELSLGTAMPLSSSGVFSKVKLDLRLYAQVVIGLGSSELATTGTFESIAQSSPDGNFLLRVGGESEILGITSDVTYIATVKFSTDDGKINGFKGGTMTWAYAGDIWGLFRVRLACTIYLLENRVGIGVKGVFENSFTETAIKAVHSFLTNLKDETNKRFDAAKNEVSKWQRQISGAKAKVDDAKNALSSVQRKMASGKDALSRAQDKLQEAKGPFLRADAVLRDAQSKVDRICGYRSCRWYKPWNCIWNVGCAIIRGIAYLALAIARAFVRIPMLILDAAILVLDAAKVVVDIAINVVEIAKVALDVVKYAMDGIVGLLEVAKTALEVVKQVVAFGLDVVNAFVKFVLGDLFNIRRASFAIEVSTKNPFKFAISFDLTILGVRMDGVGLEFDFSSASRAFASLLKSLIGLVKQALGLRRRRDLIATLEHQKVDIAWQEHQNAAAAHLQERLRRFARGAENNSVANATSASGDTTTPVLPAQGDVSTGHVCSCFQKVETFMQNSLDALLHVQKLQADLVVTKQRALDTNASFQKHLTGFRLDTMDVSDEALAENNMTRQDLQQAAIQDVIQGYPIVGILSRGFDEQALQVIDMVDNDPGWLQMWLIGVQNMTIDCADVQCSGFADCGKTSLGYLIDELQRRQEDVCLRNTSSAHREQTGCSQFTPEVAAAERKLLQLLQTTRQTFSDAIGEKWLPLPVAVADLRDVLSRVHKEEAKGTLLCGVVPTMHTFPSSTSLSAGGNVELYCAASGLPIPTIAWTKDGQTIIGEHTQRLTIVEVGIEQAGHYACVASNSMGVIRSPLAAVKVYSSTDFELSVKLEVSTFGPKRLSASRLVHSIASFLSVSHDRVEDMASLASANPAKTIIVLNILPYDLDGKQTIPNGTFNGGVQKGESNIEIYKRLSELECALRFNPRRIATSNQSGYSVLSADTQFTTRLTVAENVATGTLVHTVADPLSHAYPGNSSYTVTGSSANDVASSNFEVDPISGDVTVGKAMDYERQGSHTVQITVKHDAFYSNEATICSRVAATDWSGLLASSSKACLNLDGTLANDAVQQLEAGGLQCKTLSNVLESAEQVCFYQNEGVHVLQAACLQLCAPAGHPCGRSNDRYCPRTPELRAIGNMAKGVTAQCDGDDLAKHGVCLNPGALACDGVAMSNLRDNILAGDQACATLDGYHRAANKCLGAMRVDEPLLSEVRENCTRCAGLCRSCSSTDADSLKRTLLKLIADDVVAGCNEVASIIAQLKSCSLNDMLKGPIDLTPLEGLQTQRCENVPIKARYTDIAPKKLSEMADAVAVGDVVSCETTLLPFVKSTRLCEFGIPPSNSFDRLLHVCNTACGAACTQLSSHVIVLQVQVGNRNDNAPTFEPKMYEFVISEADNFIAGKVVGIVAADDADNDLLRYEMTEYQTHMCRLRGACYSPWKSVHDVWESIDSMDAPIGVGGLSGTLVMKTAHVMDREAIDMIKISVSARDRDNKHVANSTVWITVLDDNDNVPTLVASGPGRVQENMPPGAIVEGNSIVADDLDMQDEGKLRYVIHEATDGYDFPFAINSTTGQITTTEYLNYEVVASYSAMIKVVDTAGHMAAVPLTIVVVNADEYGFFAPSDAEAMLPTEVYPVTDNPSRNLTYQVTMHETNATGEFVLFRAPAGKHAGHGSRGNFSIVGLHPSSNNDDHHDDDYHDDDDDQQGNFPFSIDKDGWVLASGRFDRETTSEYKFKIAVTTNFSQTIEASVHVVVADVNDNAPVFAPFSGILTIADCDNSSGTLANNQTLHDMGVRVSDADAGNNAVLTYHLVDATMNAGTTHKRRPDLNDGTERVLDDTAVLQSLRFVSSTGQMCAVSTLPPCAHYEITIEARDSGQPQQVSTIVLPARPSSFSASCVLRSSDAEDDSVRSIISCPCFACPMLMII